MTVLVKGPNWVPDFRQTEPPVFRQSGMSMSVSDQAMCGVWCEVSCDRRGGALISGPFSGLFSGMPVFGHLSTWGGQCLSWPILGPAWMAPGDRSGE